MSNNKKLTKLLNNVRIRLMKVHPVEVLLKKLFSSNRSGAFSVEREKYDKPFKSLSDQISLLETNRSLDLENNAEDVQGYLLNVGYYNIINGYGEEFEDSDQHPKVYKSGTTFSDIYRQYITDQSLARAVVPDLLKIEQKLDTLLGYYIAENFGVNHYSSDDPKNIWPNDKSYLAKERYNLSNSSYASVSKLYDVIKEAKNTPLAYYRDHKNHIPPWILFASTEFGTINRYFKVLPYEIKVKLTNQLLPPQYTDIGRDDLLLKGMFNYLEIIRLFRNQFAHNSRFSFTKFVDYGLGKQFKNRVESEFLYSTAEYKSGMGKGDLYSLFIILVLFSDNYEKAAVQINYYSDTIFDQFIDVDDNGIERTDTKGLQAFLKSSNLPNNFNNRLIEFAKKLYNT
ncbi:Abi family protein [Leuconostoc lactis]|uniref:Abi family protein n=1 Tax=Leuconostoc lactis TaxID=1246 RepID=UPI0031DCA707